MKTKIVFMPLTILAIFIFSSCAKMPVFESKGSNPEKGVNSTQKIADHSDKKKKIEFGVSNDDSNLYLQVYFHKQEDLMKITRGGLQVYFDPSCNKEQNYALTITRNRGSRPSSDVLSAQDIVNMSVNNQLPGNRIPGAGEFNSKVAESITKDLERVTWKKNDNEITFIRSDNDNPIVVELESNGPLDLILTVKMPLSEISVNPGETIALGIETGTPGSGQGRPASAPQGGGMGGGGGRGGGGNMGGGMPGGGMGPGQSSTQPFRFWFLAQL